MTHYACCSMCRCGRLLGARSGYGFNRQRLDALLSEVIRDCLQCDLIYAINTDGRQVSSNIHEDAIDPGSYGQDLSHRPYLVTMPLLSNAAFFREHSSATSTPARLPDAPA